MPNIDLTASNVTRRLSFLAGPLSGVLLIAWAAWVGVGPGLATLCLLGAFGLIILAPLVQFVLLKTSLFRGQYLRVGLMVIVSIWVVLVLGALSGAFNYW